MNRLIRNIIPVFMVLTFNACDPLEHCVTRSGERVRTEIELTAFNKITLLDNIDLILIPSSIQKLELEFGENLIGNISTEISDAHLTLKNENTCNFTRNYDKPIAYLYTTNLVEINANGFGNVSNQDTLNFHKLSIIVRNGSGNITLNGQFNELNINTNGVGNIQLTGKSNLFRASYFWNSAHLFATGFEAENVVIRHRGYNQLYIFARQSLSGFIENEGHVYYKGNPTEISVEETWNGRLFPDQS